MDKNEEQKDLNNNENEDNDFEAMQNSYNEWHEDYHNNKKYTQAELDRYSNELANNILARKMEDIFLQKPTIQVVHVHNHDDSKEGVVGLVSKIVNDPFKLITAIGTATTVFLGAKKYIDDKQIRIGDSKVKECEIVRIGGDKNKEKSKKKAKYEKGVIVSGNSILSDGGIYYLYDEKEEKMILKPMNEEEEKLTEFLNSKNLDQILLDERLDENDTLISALKEISKKDITIKSIVYIENEKEYAIFAKGDLNKKFKIKIKLI